MDTFHAEASEDPFHERRQASRHQLHSKSINVQDTIQQDQQLKDEPFTSNAPPRLTKKRTRRKRETRRT